MYENSERDELYFNIKKVPTQIIKPNHCIIDCTPPLADQSPV